MGLSLLDTFSHKYYLPFMKVQKIPLVKLSLVIFSLFTLSQTTFAQEQTPKLPAFKKITNPFFCQYNLFLHANKKDELARFLFLHEEYLQPELVEEKGESNNNVAVIILKHQYSFPGTPYSISFKFRIDEKNQEMKLLANLIETDASGKMKLLGYGRGEFSGKPQYVSDGRLKASNYSLVHSMDYLSFLLNQNEKTPAATEILPDKTLIGAVVNCHLYP